LILRIQNGIAAPRHSIHLLASDICRDIVQCFTIYDNDFVNGLVNGLTAMRKLSCYNQALPS